MSQSYEAPTKGPILVIEDQDYAREALVELLRGERYSVLAASNGADALRLLRQGNTPHVILLDLLMPIMDGWEFLNELQMHPAWASIPTIILSEVPAQHPRVRVMSSVRFLQKPYRFDDVIRAIEEEETGAIVETA